MTIKEMRERAEMTQQEFSNFFKIPKRSIEDWEAGRRKCPEYVNELIKYKLIKESIIMNNKINYKWTKEYNEAQPNNGFNEEIESIVTDGVYDFSDWLLDNGVKFEEENDLYYVLDEYEERTGEAYQVINEEPTEEELRA